MQIHVNRNGQQFGPYTLGELQDFLRQGSISESDWAWHEGLTSWVLISQLELKAHSSNAKDAGAEVLPQIAEISETDEPNITTHVDPIVSGVSAESVMERLRRLQRDRMSDGKVGQGRSSRRQALHGGEGASSITQAAEDLNAPGIRQSKGKLIGMVVLGVCVVGLVAYVVTSSLDSSADAPPKNIVPEAINSDAVAKLQNIGAHVVRDEYNQISGIQFARRSNITTNGLRILAKLTNIQKLEMVDCDIDDIDAKSLRHLVHLNRLNLSENPITDKSVEMLKSLTQLQVLGLAKTKVTKNGVAIIEAALPNCRISR